MAELSIIVPVYNVEAYLRQCLDSILAQTFEDIEVIVVDDGSTDRSGEICEEYAANDRRILVIHKENGGLADARNAGLDAASGKYIAFVDSDDWIHPQMFETLLNRLEETDADITGCTMHFFSDDGKTDEVWPRIGQDYTYQRDEFIHHFFPDVKRSLMPSVCNKIFKRDIFNTIRFPFGKKYEDAYIQLDTYHCANTIAVVNEPLYEYRKRTGSITDKESFESYLNQMDFSIRHLLYFEANGPKQQSEYALAQVVKHYLIAFFAQKYDEGAGKEMLLPYSKLYRKCFIRIIENPQICRLQKAVVIISLLSPSCALRICQTYFPECLPESLKKQPERVT